MGVPKLAKHYAQIATAAAGSIAAAAIDASGIIAAQLAADSVTTVKILDANVTHDKLANNAVETVNIKDDAVDATKLNDADDYTMGTLEATEIKGTARLVTKIGSGADILIATLTTAFGAPVGLPNGSMYLYTETTSNPDKIYLVVVVGSAFWLHELTAAAAA